MLSLHLSWYLASWGMLRGSSLLLKYDYKVHHDVIKKLTKEEFRPLYENNTEFRIDLILKAKKIIQNGYNENEPTDTLTTKILLGVFGCCPAYDKFLKITMRKYGIKPLKLNNKSITIFWDYYIKNKAQIDNLIAELDLEKTKYTPMKIIDMAFYELGIEENSK